MQKSEQKKNNRRERSDMKKLMETILEFAPMFDDIPTSDLQGMCEAGEKQAWLRG